MPGHVVSHDDAGGITRVRTEAGLDVAVTPSAARPPGTPVTLAIRAEDVLVATGPVTGLSARNAYAGRLLAIDRTGVDITLPWAAAPDPAAAEDWPHRARPRPRLRRDGRASGAPGSDAAHIVEATSLPPMPDRSRVSAAAGGVRVAAAHRVEVEGLAVEGLSPPNRAR